MHAQLATRNHRKPSADSPFISAQKNIRTKVRGYYMRSSATAAQDKRLFYGRANTFIREKNVERRMRKEKQRRRDFFLSTVHFGLVIHGDYRSCRWSRSTPSSHFSCVDNHGIIWVNKTWRIRGMPSFHFSTWIFIGRWNTFTCGAVSCRVTTSIWNSLRLIRYIER